MVNMVPLLYVLFICHSARSREERCSVARQSIYVPLRLRMRQAFTPPGTTRGDRRNGAFQLYSVVYDQLGVTSFPAPNSEVNWTLCPVGIYVPVYSAILDCEVGVDEVLPTFRVAIPTSGAFTLNLRVLEVGLPIQLERTVTHVWDQGGRGRKRGNSQSKSCFSQENATTTEPRYVFNAINCFGCSHLCGSFNCGHVFV